LASVTACDSSSGELEVEIPFAAWVGSQPLACGTTYPNIGTTQSTFTIKDFKMYVSDVALVSRAGAEVPLTLTQDGIWQRDRVALLDFENDSGDCDTGSAETNLSVRGTAPDGDYEGLRFTVGLPSELNHLDAATAAAPLNAPGMWWTWKGGYKYIRLDVKSRGNSTYFFHLGADQCDGDSTTGYTCASGNTPRISLDAFEPDASKVRFDVATLWAEVDLDRQIDMQTDFIQGCMSSATDPECPTVMSRIGLSPSGGTAQSVFSVE
jgi:uncharacterized repeat protein (TIGR04052 family)